MTSHAYAKCGASVLRQNRREACGKTPREHGIDFSRISNHRNYPQCTEAHPFVLTSAK